MTKYTLVKFDADYADEFNIYGFSIFKDNEWVDHLKKVKAYFDNGGEELNFWFGTNEFITVGNYGGYIKNYEVSEITEDEMKVLAKLFGGGHSCSYYGHFDIFEDEEEDDE